jgi:hypothetical protein
MNELPLSKAFRLIEPGPVVLVTTALKGKTNVMTMSWHMVMDFTPQIGCIIGSWDYSFNALRTTKEGNKIDCRQQAHGTPTRFWSNGRYSSPILPISRLPVIRAESGSLDAFRALAA